MKTTNVNAKQVLGQYLKDHPNVDAGLLKATPALLDSVAAQTNLSRATLTQLLSEFSSAPRPDARPLTGESKSNAAVKSGPVYGESSGSARETLAREATKVATEAHAGGPENVKHKLVEKFGELIGLGLGVVVTEALAAVPSWNAPLRDASGKPVQSIEGAVRIGDHDLRKRHEEVVGPKITQYVAGLAPGVVHDLLAGMGLGATQAPGASYRLEAEASDLLHKL